MHTPPSPGEGIQLAGRRLLLVAPHPDDESLALGGLIQQAVRQGAPVTLLLVTDGDNNPWPQRWLERRWRIGARERARWGERRVAEVHAALQCLGLSLSALHRLAWPDLGVGAHLSDAPEAAMGPVLEIVRKAAPDVVVWPDLADRHPDHAACHVLLRLMLARLGLHPVCLAYRVHGRRTHDGARRVVTLDAGMVEAKRSAVLAHRTQAALARRRLLRMVGPRESFMREEPPEYVIRGAPARTVALPWHPPRSVQPWLRLKLVHGDGSHAWPWRRAPLERTTDGWRLAMPSAELRSPVFIRLESRITSPWIFDHWGWCDLTAMAFTGQAGE